MYDIKRIKNDPDAYKKVVKQKGIALDVDRLIKVYEERLGLNIKLDELRGERNKNTDEIKKLKGKPSQELIDKGTNIKKQLGELEPKFKELDEEYNSLMLLTPQVPSEDSPIGEDDSQNVPVKYYNDKPEFNFQIKDHMQLVEDLDLVDFERGVKIHGFRGYFLKNELAAMHLGLMMHSMNIMMKHGYVPMIAPSIVKEFAFWNTGHFPFGMEDVYEIKNGGVDETGQQIKDRIFLAGTAEVPLVSLHAGETFKLEDLPKKYVGFSPCYRSEVGSYGKDTKGLYRIHEFMKIEQVVICEGNYDVSEKIQQEMMSISHEILDSLGLHYRDLAICTGDMGAGKYKMFDIETWMPAREGYGETHLASNLGDWQARRANIKYVNQNGEKDYAHMLNNTALASPRVLIAILEAYQNEDGSVTVPEVLRSYIGKDVIHKK